MSNLQLQHSDYPNLTIWHHFSELANILLVHFNAQTLIEYIIQLYSDELSANPRIWFDKGFFRSVEKKNLLHIPALINQPTDLMEKAVFDKKIVKTTISPDQMSSRKFQEVVIPLLFGDQVFGAVQLDLLNNIDEVTATNALVNTITSQFSVALSYLDRMTHDEYIGQYIDFSEKIAEIRKSVLTNLDRSSLVNNLVTLMHQRFGYSQVSLLIPRNENNTSFNQVGITIDGILENKELKTISSNLPVSWSIANRIPIILNNMHLGYDEASRSDKSDFQAECVIPLIEGEKIIGALDLYHRSPNGFGPEMINGLFSLAQDIETAIRNATLFRSEHLRRSIYDRLQYAVGLVSTENSAEVVLQKLIGQLNDFVNYDAAGFWLFDTSEDEIETYEDSPGLHLVSYKVNENIKQENYPQKKIETSNFPDKYYEKVVGEEELLSLYPWLLEISNSSYPLIRNDPNLTEPIGECLGFDGDYSAIGAVLINSGQKLGILIAVDHHVDTYDAESQVILQAFINSSSIALKNVNLYTAAHDQAWISTALLQVAEATHSIIETDKLFETVTRMLTSLLDVKSCAIFIWDPAIESYTLSGSFGFDEEKISRLNATEIYYRSVPAFDELFQTLRPVILDSEALSNEILSKFYQNYDFSSHLLILFPIRLQDNLSGAILIDFSGSDLSINSPQKVWDEMYTLVEGVANQTAVNIENIQLLRTQKEETYISIALLQVAQAIVSINNLDEVLAAIVRITPILVGVKRCLIFLWDMKELVFRRSEYYGFSKAELASIGDVITRHEFHFIEAIKDEMKILYHPLSLEDSPNVWREYQQGDFSIINSVSAELNDESSIIMEKELVSSAQRLLFGFPLAVKGEFLGVMLVEEEDQKKGTPSQHIREKRIEIVKGITQQAAIAIKNDLLQEEAIKSESMERELQLAKEIQATFLPHQLPDLPGWELNAYWQPAHQVSGDFYDLLLLDDNHIGIVIADVADKGMPGALFMTLIRTLLRAAAKDHLSPAAVLKQVNELLVPDSKNSMFVTIFYGVISLSTGQFIYANAGHNPPVIKRVDSEELIELPFTSVPLGIFEDYQVDEKEQVLNKGDWIFLYTDGITEAFSAHSEMFGTERLYQKLLSDGYSTSEEFLKRIENAVNNFTSGVEISDDITMAVIYRKC